MFLFEQRGVGFWRSCVLRGNIHLCEYYLIFSSTNRWWVRLLYVILGERETSAHLMCQSCYPYVSHSLWAIVDIRCSWVIWWVRETAQPYGFFTLLFIKSIAAGGGCEDNAADTHLLTKWTDEEPIELCCFQKSTLIYHIWNIHVLSNVKFYRASNKRQ